jgi:hypothetical protein
MAERIVSPGVFTQERDLSFLEQGVGEIAGAFIGPTPRGPAFIPTIVTSPSDFEAKFGVPDGKSFLGSTVKNYLRESGQATVVRILGLDGYSNITHTPVIVKATGTSGSFVYAILHPTVSGSDVTAASGSGTPSNFTIAIATSNGQFTGSSLSSTTSAGGYIGNFFGFGPTGTKGAYVYGIFPEAIVNAGASVELTAETAQDALMLSGSTFGTFTFASTPWVQSQELGGINQNLFKIHTLSDGSSANKEVKISIVAPKKALIEGDYGTFTLQVRAFNDTDSIPSVLEQYDGLSLDPNSPNYVARRIGNSSPVNDPNTGERYFQGDFRNNSRYIRVEMADGSENVSPDALPFGFAALKSPIGTETSNLPSPTYISSIWTSGSSRGFGVNATQNVNEYYGYQFSDVPNTNMSYLAPLPSGSATVGVEFNLENLASNELYEPGTGENYTVSQYLDGTAPSLASFLKFTVPFQGGFDGLNPAREIKMYDGITANNTQGFDLSTSTTAGSRAYKKALDAIANPDSFDLNLLVLPGVIYSQHSYIATYALNICEQRGDCFYIMDLVGASDSITAAVNTAALIDSNYAAGYYPWVRVLDSDTNKFAFVPPSAVLPEVFAYSDNTSAEWFAPAGLNRGGIPGAAGVKTRLTQASRDELYEGKVNPIAQFPGQGICVWGQKTLQRRPSALDRVNVRRLLITVKKFIASSARFLVFEQNVEVTRRRFLNIVNPFLANVQERSGLYAFRVIMDDTNNTPDIIDRNILVGQLYLQPTKTAEFIKLEFNILPTGATFPGA